jgi:hypothetical protein
LHSLTAFNFLTAFIAAALAGISLLVARQGNATQRLRLLAEQDLASQRGEAETLRAAMASTERALSTSMSSASGQLRLVVSGAIAEMRTGLDARLRELREGTKPNWQKSRRA